MFVDINECGENNGGCEYKCVNIPGSFRCECKNGYTLTEDLKSCTGNTNLYAVNIIFILHAFGKANQHRCHIFFLDHIRYNVHGLILSVLQTKTYFLQTV